MSNGEKLDEKDKKPTEVLKDELYIPLLDIFTKPTEGFVL
jgi:hypothetical protein